MDTPEMWEEEIKNLQCTTPYFYFAREVKRVYEDELNKIRYTRLAGMITFWNGVYVVYNLRDEMPKWIADGETKILWHMESMFEPLRQHYHPFQKVALIVLAILQMFDIWTQAINLCVPLMGVNLLFQTYTQWNTSRKTAYFSLSCAVFVFACTIAVFFIK